MPFLLFIANNILLTNRHYCSSTKTQGVRFIFDSFLVETQKEKALKLESLCRGQKTIFVRLTYILRAH